MIKLTDFLLANKVPLNLHSYKVHLATGKTKPPLQAFFAGEFKEWQEHQRHKNFKKEMVIGLIEYNKNKWLFAGVYKILSYKKIKEKHIQYSTELIPGQDDLIGRIIVEHKRTSRASYLNGKPDGGDFYLSELKEQKLTMAEFPGFHYVSISFDELNVIISQSISSWHSALSNMKGIYLITDTNNGKLYVGKADGKKGLWQRWSDYSKNGHGGNVELKKILKNKSSSYFKNFQYTILEIAGSNTPDEDIDRREVYWKKVLLSREFGYNSN